MKGIQGNGTGLYSNYPEKRHPFIKEIIGKPLDFTKKYYNASIKVVKIDIDTNKPLKIYDSISQAARAVERNKTGIIDCIAGQTKTCGGFKWEKLKI